MEETTEATPELTLYEYGAMSTRYSILAENKLTAYCAMLSQYGRNNHLIALYEPESILEDSWLSITGRVAARLDEIFGGDGSFDVYFESHIPEIKAALKTVKQIC